MLTKTTDEVKEYYTQTYINGIIGEGMPFSRPCDVQAGYKAPEVFKNFSLIGTIPKDFHRKFLDHCGGESG